MIYGSLFVVLVGIAFFHQAFGRQCYGGRTCDNQTVVFSYYCANIISANISRITAKFSVSKITNNTTGVIAENGNFYIVLNGTLKRGGMNYYSFHVEANNTKPDKTTYAMVLVPVDNIVCIGDQVVRNAFEQSSNERARVNVNIQSKSEHVSKSLVTVCTATMSVACSAKATPTPTKMSATMATPTFVKMSPSVNTTRPTAKSPSSASKPTGHPTSTQALMVSILTVSILSL